MSTKIVCMAFLLAAGSFLPQNGLMAGSRKDSPNAVDLELAGKCLLYSFSYQRMLAEPFGIEVGVSALGEGSSESSTSLLFFTFGGKLYIIQGNASPYIGAGIVALSAAATAGPFSSDGTGTYGYISPGFEFRSESGFLVRGSVYALIGGGGFFVWPGLSVGVAF